MGPETRIRRRLKLRDLDTLIAVAQSGSMAKAAVRLSISQPAVSKAIADLENTVGVQLLDRTSQGIAPTPYGRTLLKWAAVVFDDVRQGIKELELLADPTAGEVRIGATESMVAGMLPVVFDELNKRYPKIWVGVTQINAVTQQYQDLRERKIDLLLGRVQLPLPENDLNNEILFSDPLVVVAGAKSPWLRKRRVKLAELVNEAWTLPQTGTVANSLIVDAFRAHGLEPPRCNIACNSIPLHNALLESGRFLAVFPRSVLHFAAKRLDIKVLPVELGAQLAPSGIVTLRSRTISPVVQLFIDCVREIAKPMSREMNQRR